MFKDSDTKCDRKRTQSIKTIKGDKELFDKHYQVFTDTSAFMRWYVTSFTSSLIFCLISTIYILRIGMFTKFPGHVELSAVLFVYFNL